MSEYNKEELESMADLITDYISKRECKEGLIGNDYDCVNCGNIEDGNLLTISSCGCNQDSDTALNNGLSARINVIPNSNNNGRTGNVCGCYRRR